MSISQKARHILHLSREEKIAFLDSFDIILSDCDGVVWLVSGFIPKTAEAIILLKNAGKSYKFISNNSLRTDQQYEERFAEIGIPDISGAKDVVHPVKTITAYLKTNPKYKRLFSIASVEFNAHLEEAGYEIVEMNQPEIWTLASFAADVPPTDTVDAVIMDIDLNVNHAKLCRAHQYLLQPKCDFLVGATDKYIPTRVNFTAIGTANAIKTLWEISGKEPIVLGKPGPKLGQYLLENFQISNPKRALFIGDVLIQDIQFGGSCGFQTLFVLSGADTFEEMMTKPEELKPDYYADSMADFVKFFADL